MSVDIPIYFLMGPPYPHNRIFLREKEGRGPPEFLNQMDRVVLQIS
jgi:hypothetical protein